VYISAVL